MILIIISAVLAVLIATGTIIYFLWPEDSNGKKKQIVIVKRPSASQNDTDKDDNNPFEVYTPEGGDEDHYDGVRRELYKKTQNNTVEYVPEYKVTAKSWNGPKGYVIVIPNGDKQAEKIAKTVQEYFKSNAGITLSIVTDETKEQNKEILIGNTNRYKTHLKENEYAVKLSGDKLIFEGGHSAMLEKAADWFTAEKYTEGKVNTLTGQTKDFSSTKNGGYTYVWGDEFAGSKINTGKWNFADRDAGSALSERITDKSVASVNQDNLRLKAIRSYRIENPVAQYAAPQSVTTMESMSFKYGYLEMSARLPLRTGSIPSFWLNSDGALNQNKSLPYSIEVDIFEGISSYDTVTPNIHKWRGAGTHSQYNTNNLVEKAVEKAKKYVFEDTENLLNEYHIYGFKWTDKEMTMSVDGKEYMTFDLTKDFDEEFIKSLEETPDGMEGFKEPMAILLNCSLFAPDSELWGGASYVNNTDLPFEYDIDWIRLYQIEGQGELNLAD